MMFSHDKVMTEVHLISDSEVGTTGSSYPENLVADDMSCQYQINEPLISVIADDQLTGRIPVEQDPSKNIPTDPEVINPRGYQKEMLEQSLKRNVIIAMDTGSGKTQVAVMRIQRELETCSPDKLNIDAWSEDVWPRILEGTRIIVSTFDILRDTLDHAFVKMDTLALIVFDEVHNCVKNSSGRKIMMNFYHENKKAGISVPAILGLTASPVQSKSRLSETQDLESTMDARCVTPTVNRKELLKHVNKPNLVRVLYDDEKHRARTSLMQTLQKELMSMDVTEDPGFAKSRDSVGRNDKSRAEMLVMLMRDETFSQNQLKSLWNKSKDILDELGPWAADRYISEMVSLFLEGVNSPTACSESLKSEERIYLARHLRCIAVAPNQLRLPARYNMSDKVNKLIQELLSTDTDVVGIIFVRSRAAVNVLCALLKEHPDIRKRYRVGSIVGSSSSKTRKQNMYEYPASLSNDTLRDFRSGAINLLVSTSVLEEGIDVASHIQRRGRARKQKSRMIVLQKSSSDVREWDTMEKEMKSRYEHDRDELDRLEVEARAEATSSISYSIPNSGARLDLENSRQHLEHFCNKVFQRDFVDPRPIYVFHKTENGTEASTFSATVTLPSALPHHLRKFQGGGGWRSEKNAMKDAAFHAYLALYQDGLVSDHLLPLNADTTQAEEEVKMTEPELLFNPWMNIAQKWETTTSKWLYAYEFVDPEYVTPLRFEIALPVELPRPRDITVHPEEGLVWSVRCTSVKEISDEECASLPDHTSTLLTMHFGHRWTVEDRDHVVKVIYETKDLSRDHIGSVPFSESIDAVTEKRVLVRDARNAPFHYLRTIQSKPHREDVQHPFNEYEEAPEEPYLVVEQWTRRSDLFHALKPGRSTTYCAKPYRWVLPISRATVDKVPRRAVKFGMLIPSIIHDLEVQLIASELSSTLLAPVGIADLQLVLEAISSRSAAEPVDYERLEFLGDSVLKFCTVTQAYSEHPFWPEGLLNHFKDRLVSNTRLMSMCLETGLSKFILSKNFTGVKWRPLYRDAFLDAKPVDDMPRFIGPKNLADVVEALIGASFQDGGMDKALKCIKVFLGTKCNWFGEGMARDMLYREAPSDVKLPPTMEPLEELIGYEFQKKSLLIEAMTHGSYAADAQQRSYEQLEFLGDAVLDYIIVSRMFQFNPPVPNGRLHMIKTALVNAEFLAFTNMQHGLRREDIDFKDGEPVSTEVILPIWKFMRHSSPEMGRVMTETEERFESLRDEINAIKTEGTHYPWRLLARLHPKKFYSDLFEAILGAIWVDSGNIEVCAAFLRKFDILPYLDRILNEKIHVQHPKEELSKLAVDQKMAYICTPVDGPVKEYLCTVKVGDRPLGIISGAINKLEAMTKAAEQAVGVLKDEQRRAEKEAEEEVSRFFDEMDLS
ncbi:dicer 2 [Fusarium longipes]|uniref:Dicer 2 n=1 Tax=Fusarium longipes TaxID=694270 RepID=A0A395SVW8_9HYPO|nr:dicer 2 [Fusarium longipes]